MAEVAWATEEIEFPCAFSVNERQRELTEVCLPGEGWGMRRLLGTASVVEHYWLMIVGALIGEGVALLSCLSRRHRDVGHAKQLMPASEGGTIGEG